MKLKNHLEIIKNFADISPAMIFTSDKIRIINQSESISGIYEWGEKLPIEKIGIYKVRKFVQVVSLFEDPDIEFVTIEGSKYKLLIKENTRKSEYFATDPSLIKYDDREVKEEKIGEFNVCFCLTKALYKKMKEVIAVVEAKHIIFGSDESENLIITLKDKDNDSADNYEIKILKDNTDYKLKGKLNHEVTMYSDDFLLYEGEYEVKIYENTIFKFEDSEKKLIYFVALKK